MRSIYINSMKEMFMQIPQTMIKSLTPKQKFQNLMTDIGGEWYMEKCAKGLPPLRIPQLSKNHKRNRFKFKKNYIKLISGGMVVNSNYIETSLNGWIQNLSSNGINPIQFIQKSYT